MIYCTYTQENYDEFFIEEDIYHIKRNDGSYFCIGSDYVIII